MLKIILLFRVPLPHRLYLLHRRLGYYLNLPGLLDCLFSHWMVEMIPMDMILTDLALLAHLVIIRWQI